IRKASAIRHQSSSQPMKRRPASLAVVAALAAFVVLNTAARPMPKHRAAKPAVVVKTVAPATVEETISIDWRVLAGLNYTNGKLTDSLKKLEGKLVKIPGFVVPLDDFQEDGAEFLLVPYYGACVHTPPPPPNQIVMVEMDGKKSVKLGLFDAVWLSGRLKIASVDSPYGQVGYQLVGIKVEPYTTK
ncbi:MAG: DUF3299 domain-containing protein, partial [Gemmatimonadota bacterium]|nr:DUF3299 domain-containing protein [Gemmatimonadota bacterium]